MCIFGRKKYWRRRIFRQKYDHIRTTKKHRNKKTKLKIIKCVY